MNQLIPQRMFRGHDAEKRPGTLYVLAHKHGPDGKVAWFPDAKKTPVDEHVAHLEQWEESELAKSITRFHEIPISEGTESLSVVHVPISAGPRGMSG